MIAFRHYDSRYPFLWESADQPAGRWHAAGEGPTQYLADTPHGAWAEFLRHEEITDPADLEGVARGMCAVEIDETECDEVSLPRRQLLGDPDTYPSCRRRAAAMRAAGSRGLAAPSAALLPGGASGEVVDGGMRPGPARDGRVLVLFGARPHLVGWAVATAARPPDGVLRHVRPFTRPHH